MMEEEKTLVKNGRNMFDPLSYINANIMLRLRMFPDYPLIRHIEMAKSEMEKTGIRLEDYYNAGVIMRNQNQQILKTIQQ